MGGQLWGKDLASASFRCAPGRVAQQPDKNTPWWAFTGRGMTYPGAWNDEPGQPWQSFLLMAGSPGRCLGAGGVPCRVPQRRSRQRRGHDTADAAAGSETSEPHKYMLSAMPSRRQSSAIEVSPRRPSSTTRIFSSAAWCFRVARRMLRTSVSDDRGGVGFLSHLRSLRACV